jgi:hypothetical protein
MRGGWKWLLRQALVVLNFCIASKVGLVKANGYELDSWNSFPLKEFKNF